MTEVKTRRSRGKIRPVAGREQVLAAARGIGVRQGWKAVTIRAVARELGYTSPVLYEHFRDKQDLLTQLAIEGQLSLATELARELPQAPYTAALVMVERYWTFMLENTSIYRLMNAMDGVPIDRKRLGRIAQRSFETVKAVIQTWLIDEGAQAADADAVVDELWAVLHGMAALYLDRFARFDLAKAQDCIAKLLMGIRMQAAKAGR